MKSLSLLAGMTVVFSIYQHFLTLFSGMSVDLGTRNVLDLLQFLSKTSGRFTYISGLNNDTSAIYLEGKFSFWKLYPRCKHILKQKKKRPIFMVLYL